MGTLSTADSFGGQLEALVRICGSRGVGDQVRVVHWHAGS